MIRRQGGSLSGIGCNISLGDEEAEFDIFQKASPLPLQNGQKVIACPSSALIFMLSKIALQCAKVLVKSSLCCKMILRLHRPISLLREQPAVTYDPRSAPLLLLDRICTTRWQDDMMTAPRWLVCCQFFAPAVTMMAMKKTKLTWWFQFSTFCKLPLLTSSSDDVLADCCNTVMTAIIMTRWQRNMMKAVAMTLAGWQQNMMTAMAMTLTRWQQNLMTGKKMTPPSQIVCSSYLHRLEGQWLFLQNASNHF